MERLAPFIEAATAEMNEAMESDKMAEEDVNVAEEGKSSVENPEEEEVKPHIIKVKKKRKFKTRVVKVVD